MSTLRNIIKEEILREAKVKVSKDEFIKLFEDDTILVLKPLTHQASCKYGSGTRWCVTSRTTSKYWDQYTRKTASFAGVNWYNVKEVVTDIEKTWLDRLLGKPGKEIKREVKEFIEQFPIGILYFVIVKKRIVDHVWDEELDYAKPVYDVADPKDPMNKLALLYQPDRADFGDLSTSDKYNFFDYISDKVDAAHNNLSIFNALDTKVTLKQVGNMLGKQFGVALTFIEEDFQKEREGINTILKNVLDKIPPLAGGEGSKEPITWLTGQDGELYKSKTSDVTKTNTGRSFKGRQYKQGNW